MATVDIESPPPLTHGDNLTREEFLRLWEMNPDIKKAELIGGVVYMPSPVSLSHGANDYHLGGWTFNYKVATPGVDGCHNTTTYLLEGVAQPEISLRILPEYGGKTWIQDKYLAGSPEFLGEVCASTASYDLHQKLDLYEAAGVQEYLAILVYKKEIRWHILENGKYQLLKPDADGILRSRVFPGLWLDASAFFKGDMRRVLEVLQAGVDSPEHKAFVQKLADKASGAA